MSQSVREANLAAYEMILSRRSVRAFEPEPVPEEVLKKMCEAGRQAPTGANRQPFEFLVVTRPDLLAKVYETLKWAAYIAPHGDPPAGKEPTAYIVLLRNDREGDKVPYYDCGFVAAQTLLAGLCFGVAGCALLSFDPKKVHQDFQLPDHLQPEMVLALGYPAEFPVSVDREDTVKYWRDDQERHFVPKYPLDKITHLNGPA
jgi:nitroreductase